MVGAAVMEAAVRVCLSCGFLFVWACEQRRRQEGEGLLCGALQEGSVTSGLTVLYPSGGRRAGLTSRGRVRRARWPPGGLHHAAPSGDPGSK